MPLNIRLTEKQQDFLRELMNIGSGNAGTSLSQLFKCKVEIMMPEMYIVQQEDILPVIQNPEKEVTCLKTRFLGDIQGDLLIMINNDQKAFLVNIMERAAFGSYDISQKIKDLEEWKDSIMKEMASIFVGSFLGAVSRFCGLNFSHMMPELYINRIRSIIHNLKEEWGLSDVILFNKSMISIMETPVEILVAIVLPLDFAATLETAIIKAEKIITQS